MDRYTTLAAEQMHDRGPACRLRRRRASPARGVPPQLRPAPRLQRRHAGLIISAMNAHYVFLKFAKLWALESRAVDSALTRRRSIVHIDTARDLARRAEPGPAHRHGPRGDRPPGRARRARRRRAAAPRARGPALRAVSRRRSEFDVHAGWQLNKVIADVKPDVVHAHDPMGVALAAMALQMPLRPDARRRCSSPPGAWIST